MRSAMKRPLLATLIASTCILSATPALSAPIIFFGEDVAGASLPAPNSAAAGALFLSNLVGVQTENFEAIPVGTQFNFDVTFGADTATLSGTNTVNNTGVRDAEIAGRFAISGARYLNIGTTDAQTFTLTFSTPQAAFGFYGTDIGDFTGQLAISLDGGAPILVNHTLNAPDGNALFWGVIDTDNPFTTVEFQNTGGRVLDDAFGFDDFTIGRQENVVLVPTPGTAALLGLGLVGLGLSRRARS